MRKAALLVLLGVAGCSMPSVQTVCPAMVPYSQQDQAALAGELRAHPDLIQVPRWLQDYIGLRDQVRACRNTGKQ